MQTRRQCVGLGGRQVREPDSIRRFEQVVLELVTEPEVSVAAAPLGANGLDLAAGASDLRT